MIIINAQLTFESIRDYLCKNSKENIIDFPVKKAKNNTLKSNFTSQGKPKAGPADSVKTLEKIEQIKKYFLDRKEYRNYCLFIVGITTGYRIGDLLNLRFSDFLNSDYSFKSEINIIEQKTSKRRKMPINENIKQSINLYIRQIGFSSFNDYVFQSQKGKNNPLDVSSVRSIFNTMAINLGLPYHPQRTFSEKPLPIGFCKYTKTI